MAGGRPASDDEPVTYTRVPTSLTGSDVGLPATHRSSVSIALGQLRRLVSFCVAVLVLALVAQAAVWAIVTFADVRYVDLDRQESAAAELVVAGGDDASSADVPDEEAALLDPLGERVVPPEPPPVSATPNVVRSTTDRILELTATLAGACGRLATAALLPLVALGVLLAAASATDGVERTVTGFAWATVTLFLVFPIAADFGMPWHDGGLWDYPELASLLDAEAVPPVELYVQYAVVPFTTMLAALIARGRFAAGVEAGLIRGEDLRLDPTLERETAGITPGSLHGSRNARVMEAFTEDGEAAMPGPPAPAATPHPSMPSSTGPPVHPGSVGGGAATANAAMLPGVATPADTAGSVGPAPELPPTGTEGEHGGGPMRTSAGDAPRRLI